MAPPQLSGARPSSLDLQLPNAPPLAIARACSLDILQGVLAVDAVAFHLVSGPQGHVRPFTIVDDPCAWHAADWTNREAEFSLELTPSDVAAVDAALADLRASGRPLESLRCAADFPLPAALAAHLAAARRDVLDGRGFVLMRGLPVGRWGEWESLAAYLGLCSHIGVRGPQSKDGKLVNHVKMLHKPAADAAAAPAAAAAAAAPKREHGDNGDFSFHTDAQADVLGLLCIRQAAEGGVSSWASAVTVHNKMLAMGRSDLVACLAAPGWFRDRARYQDLAPGECPVWDMPVFSYHAGRLIVHFNPSHYRLCAKRYPEWAPALTPLQEEALALFSALADSPELKAELRLAPGDILLLNNATALHARSAFVDGAAPEQQRHLVRLWLGVRERGGAAAPPHLRFPRSYGEAADHEQQAAAPYNREAFVGLMKPDPASFFVPMSDAADGV